MIGSPSNEKRTLKTTWNIQSHLPQAWCAFLRDCIAHVKRLMGVYVCPTKCYRYICSYFYLNHVDMFLSHFTDELLIQKNTFMQYLNYKYMVSIMTVSYLSYENKNQFLDYSNRRRKLAIKISSFKTKLADNVNMFFPCKSLYLRVSKSISLCWKLWKTIIAESGERNCTV